jgi:putative ABC transport system substrate-binding protein
MRRREFITVLGGAATLGPFAARAQQAGKIWRIGMLDSVAAELNTVNIAAFHRGMRQLGYVEGQNLKVEYHSSNGRSERLPELISELLRLGPDLIMLRGTPEALAVKSATATIPVVMIAVADPVGSGIIANLARPGGNFTGQSSFVTELEAKRVEMLKDMVPGLKRMATVRDFSNPATTVQWEEVQRAARSLAIEALPLDVRSAADLGRAFETAVREQVGAILVAVDGVTRANQRQIIELAARHKLPAIYPAREFVADGGLFTYGVAYPQLYFRAATFVDKIFKGAKAADLPVEQPTKLELVINLKTAKTLGLAVPPTLLVLADEVIE